MSGGILSDEADVVFTLSVILLCFLSLQWMFVLFLVFLLRKIQQRVNRVRKEWRVYSKVAVDITLPLETENPTATKNGYSFPLVISNMRAVNSDTDKSWKKIDRTFAYAQSDHEEDENQRDLEGTSVEQAEDNKTQVDSSTSQEAALPNISNDTSCINVVDESPAVLFLAGERPYEKHGQKGIFMTLNGHAKFGKDSSPAQKECSLVLIDADNLLHENQEECTWFTNETFEKQSRSKETCILEIEKQSIDEKPSAEYLVPMDQNRGQSTSKAFHAVKKNNTDGNIDSEKLISEGTSGVTESADSRMPRHEDESTMPRHEDESDIIIPTATEPKEKQKHKHKKRINRQFREKRKVSGERPVPLQDIIHEDEHGNLQAQHVDKLAEDERKNAVGERKFQQAERNSGAQDEISQCVEGDGHVNRHAEHIESLTDKASCNVPVNQCNGRFSAEIGARKESNETAEDSYDCIPTATEPKEKQKHKQKKRINRQYRGKRRASGERPVPLQDNIHEDEHGNLQAQHVDKLAEDERKNAVRERKFQQAEQYSGAQDEISQCVEGDGHVNRHAEHIESLTDKASSNVPVNQCNGRFSAEIGARKESNETAEDSYDCIPTATEPKEKQKHKQKKRINRQASGERPVPLQDNILEDENGNLQAQHVDKLAEDERENAVRKRKFQQAEQYSRAQDEISQGVNKGRVNRLAKHVQSLTDKTSSNVPVNHCKASVNAEHCAQMESNETVEDSYDCINTQDSKQWQTKSPGNINRWKFGDDGDTKETKQDVQNISDEIYSNIDDENDGSRDMPNGTHPGYVNCKKFEYVDEEVNDDSHIYANADELQQESVMFNDSPAFDHAGEGPIYVNLTEIMDV